MPFPVTVFKSVTLSPISVLAGDSAEIIIRMVVGPGYTAGPSRIILDLPATVGMSRPSLSHQEDHGFMEVYVSAPAVTYTKRNWDMEIADFPTRTRQSWRGMAQRLFVVDLSAGLREDDTIEIHWGDAGNGFGPGTKITSVVPRPDYKALIHVRYFDDPSAGLPDLGRSFEGMERPTPTCEAPLELEVKTRAPQHLRLIRKTDKAMLIPHDLFWNVPPVTSADELVTGGGRAKKNAFGVFEIADKNVQVITRRLPVRQTATMDDVFEGCNLYWGDIHTHSSISNDCIEREKLQMTPADLMASARQRAGLDFYAVTDHHQPWDKPRNRIGRAAWEATLDAVSKHDKPGEFLVFPGYEFRCKRGDTAIVFNAMPRHEQIDRAEMVDIRALWKGLSGLDYLSIAHFHNGGGLEPDAWWENIAEGVEPVLEIFSCHGSYERPDAMENGRPQEKSWRPDRCGSWMLSRGLRYGLVANSDGHKGHVGSSGVTAVYAKSLDKASIFAAYRNRHVYGTTNARIRLMFTANGKLMGSALSATTKKTFFIDAIGEGELKRVDLYRNTQLHRTFAPTGLRFTQELRIEDEGASNWYVRVTQRDNHIAWSSPVWFG